MQKQLFTIAFCLFTSLCTQAQTGKPAQSVFAELAGPGIASINYDTRFTKQNGGIGGRVGLGGFSIDGTSVFTVPLGLNYLLSKDDRNFFELGAGYTYLHASDKNNSGDVFDGSFGHLHAGYRLQPAAGGFQFRAGITPVFGSGFFIPYYFSLSFGYKF